MSWSKFQQAETTSLREQQTIEFSTDRLSFASNSHRQSPYNNSSRSEFLRCEISNRSIFLMVTCTVITICLYQFYIWNSHSPAQLQGLIDYFNSLSQPSSQGKLTYQDQAQVQMAQDFNLNLVQTQYQGKQTEEMLAKAALAEIEKKFNVAHLPGFLGGDEQKLRKKLLQDISNLDVMIPDQSINGYVAENFYFFSVSVHDLIMNSNLYLIYRNAQTIFKISLKQHMRAIIRTQLVHNVNFKGEIKVELSPFDKGVDEKEKAIREIMEDEELYYESFYQLSRYNRHQLRFCLLVPSYKNVKSRLYLRNLDSIFMQDYQNYHVVYIDDASPDLTGEYVRKYLQERGIPNDKIQVFINDENKKAMYNIYNGIHSYCPDGEVVGLIDGDDSLLGRKVLQLYNAVYQEKRSALIYSNFLKILTNNMTSFGFGTELSKGMFESGILRNSLELMGSHFMTFFSDLFKLIKKQDLCYENGTFYDYAYDRAIITPMIEMAFPRVQYLAEITYEYRNDTGINDGTEDWERVSRVILNNKPYKQISNFSFIDDFVDQTQRLTEKPLKKQALSEGKPFIEDQQQEEMEHKQKYVQKLQKG